MKRSLVAIFEAMVFLGLSACGPNIGSPPVPSGYSSPSERAPSAFTTITTTLASTGKPIPGVAITLTLNSEAGPVIAKGTTNKDGKVTLGGFTATQEVCAQGDYTHPRGVESQFWCQAQFPPAAMMEFSPNHRFSPAAKAFGRHPRLDVDADFHFHDFDFDEPTRTVSASLRSYLHVYQWLPIVPNIDWTVLDRDDTFSISLSNECYTIYSVVVAAAKACYRSVPDRICGTVAVGITLPVIGGWSKDYDIACIDIPTQAARKLRQLRHA